MTAFAIFLVNRTRHRSLATIYILRYRLQLLAESSIYGTVYNFDKNKSHFLSLRLHLQIFHARYTWIYFIRFWTNVLVLLYILCAFFKFIVFFDNFLIRNLAPIKNIIRTLWQKIVRSFRTEEGIFWFPCGFLNKTGKPK